MQDAADINDLGSLCSYLSNAPEGAELYLGGSELRMTSTNGGAQQKWESESLYPKSLPVTFSNVEAGMYTLSGFESTPSICAVSAVKAAVFGAKIVMSEYQCLVLDAVCSDVTFRDVSFEGVIRHSFNPLLQQV
ncbi:MAG: hypothetical protein HC767_06130 [Akkermansiaceae bacterium]|nr:hypothetical protein [Akkermansiaceae bacterium]